MEEWGSPKEVLTISLEEVVPDEWEKKVVKPD